MSATHAARREPRFAWFATRRPAPVPEPVVPDEAIARREAEAARRDLEAMFAAAAPHAEAPRSPVHMVGDEYDIMPCCEQHETAVPQTHYVTANPRLVTCRTSAHDTMLDNRAAMPRPFIPEPEPYTPDLCADLADLPLFRETIGRRTRCHAGECLCGHEVTGETWAERMVRAGIHLFNSDADRIMAIAPHLTLAAAVTLSDQGRAA